MFVAYHAPILHRHQHCLQMDRNEIPHDPCHLGVPTGASKRIFEPTVCSAQTMHLSCTDTNTVSKWTDLSLEPRHLGVPSGASKMISEPMVCLAQTVHLSFTDTNTVSKWKEERFHMMHVTKEFHRVRPKWSPRLGYIRQKPRTYLSSRLALSPNRPKRVFTSASSTRRTNGCV